jgi:hypothetical protein
MLESLRQELSARQELARAVVAFDVTQVRLYTVVGRPPAPGASPK